MILLQFWTPESKMSSLLSAGLYSPWRFQERICSLPLPASGGSWQPLACGHITPLFASLVTCPSLCLFQISLCLPLTSTPVMALRAHPDNPGSSSLLQVLSLVASIKILFPNKVMSTDSRNRDLYISGRHDSAYHSDC